MNNQKQININKVMLAKTETNSFDEKLEDELLEVGFGVGAGNDTPLQFALFSIT